MKKITVQISYEMTLSYDENSENFKQAYADYTAAIDENADVESMLTNVAIQVQQNGSERMVEGVGYVMCRGYVEDPDIFSGIEVDDDDPMADVEVLEHV